MQFRTWPLAAVALGALLLLIVFALLESSRRAQDIYVRLDASNRRYHEIESKLRRLRSDVNLSAIFVRDYLLDPAPARIAGYRQRISEFNRVRAATFAELETLADSQGTVATRLHGLRTRLDDYWSAIGPLFDGTSADVVSGARLLRTEVIPRREAVLAVTAEIEEVNDIALAAQRSAAAREQARLRSDLFTLLWMSLALGGVVAITAVFRLRQLERRSVLQHAEAEAAERTMRQLSQQLVHAQEKERTDLSRELHDHVGQMLTALRMELGTIDRLRRPDDRLLAHSVTEGRGLVDTIVGTVRDIALGLRPSMLDDLGLQAALEWHARDFTRRYELPVNLQIEGDLDDLPDTHRTAVYRILQEALTNCARHSGAERIRVKLRRTEEALEVSVVDDGLGFDVNKRRGGIGLHGIEERVRELGGESRIRSVRGAGTTIWFSLPLAGPGAGKVAYARSIS